MLKQNALTSTEFQYIWLTAKWWLNIHIWQMDRPKFDCWLETFRYLPDYTYLCLHFFARLKTHIALGPTSHLYNWRAARIKKFRQRKPAAGLPAQQNNAKSITASLAINYRPNWSIFTQKHLSVADECPKVKVARELKKVTARSLLSLHPNVNTRTLCRRSARETTAHQITAKSHSRKFSCQPVGWERNEISPEWRNWFLIVIAARPLPAVGH
jgi:hypothetical protein